MFSYVQTLCVIPNELAVIQDTSLNNLLKKICDNIYYTSSYLTKNDLLNNIKYYHDENETKVKIKIPEITGVIMGNNLSFKYIKNFIENYNPIDKDKYNYIDKEKNYLNSHEYTYQE